MILGIAEEWPSKRYDFIRCNCIHFSGELLQQLGVGSVPSWITGLHETGALAAAWFSPTAAWQPPREETLPPQQAQVKSQTLQNGQASQSSPEPDYFDARSQASDGEDNKGGKAA